MYPSFKKHEVIRTKALCSCVVTPTPPHLPSKWEAGLCSSPSSILTDLFNSSLFLFLIRMITYKDMLTEQKNLITGTYNTVALLNNTNKQWLHLQECNVGVIIMCNNLCCYTGL